jgi:uncharacterized protein YjiS (DUF1127 family)
MTLIHSFPRRAERAARSPLERLARAFGDLANWIRHRRQMRVNRALLATFDDRLLADIGLRRDQIDPGPQSDIIGIMLSRDGRGTRFDWKNDG